MITAEDGIVTVTFGSSGRPTGFSCSVDSGRLFPCECGMLKHMYMYVYSLQLCSLQIFLLVTAISYTYDTLVNSVVRRNLNVKYCLA